MNYSWLNIVAIPPVNMLMTGGWCRWHCFTYINWDIVGLYGTFCGSRILISMDFWQTSQETPGVFTQFLQLVHSRGCCPFLSLCAISAVLRPDFSRANEWWAPHLLHEAKLCHIWWCHSCSLACLSVFPVPCLEAWNINIPITNQIFAKRKIWHKGITFCLRCAPGARCVNKFLELQRSLCRMIILAGILGYWYLTSHASILWMAKAQATSIPTDNQTWQWTLPSVNNSG